MKNKLPENNSTRLASLDILRGFDLFLLVFFQPVFAALVRQMNLPFLNGILYQFDHEVWEGFRFWDLRRWKADLNEPVYGISWNGNSYQKITVEERSYEDYMYCCPIPNSEILKYSNLIQNKGWK